MNNYETLNNGQNSFVDKSNINITIEKIIDDSNPDTLGLIVFKDVNLDEIAKILLSNNILFNKNLPLVMTKNHIYLNIRKDGYLKGNYHNIDVNKFVKAIYELDKPKMIFCDKSSIVVVVDIKDSHDNTIIIPIRLMENIQNSTIEANIILSVYGKKGFESFIRKKKLIYEKK